MDQRSRSHDGILDTWPADDANIIAISQHATAATAESLSLERGWAV